MSSTSEFLPYQTQVVGLTPFADWWGQYGISGKDNEWSARTAWEAATKLANAEYTKIGYTRHIPGRGNFKYCPNCGRKIEVNNY